MDEAGMICSQQVGGSIPLAGPSNSSHITLLNNHFGEIALPSLLSTHMAVIPHFQPNSGHFSGH